MKKVLIFQGGWDGHEPKLVSARFAKLMEEDLTLKTVNDSANRQTLIYGMGDQHLDVVVSKLLERYKVDIELGKPKIAFKETIRKNSDVDAKYKKQSGGHGQYGHVKMKFEPSGNLEEAYTFEQIVVGGAVPKNYFPAVEKGLQDSVGKGPLAAYPVVGVKATLYDGSYHPVDSSEMAFKTATVQAFKKGFMEAGPVLLEPIANIKASSTRYLFFILCSLDFSLYYIIQYPRYKNSSSHKESCYLSYFLLLVV